MNRLCGLLIAGALALAAKEPPPDAAAQKAMLEGVKTTAQRYQAELPDFVCTLLTKRSTDASGSGKHLRQRDTDEVQFTYVGRVPNREVLKVNGRPARTEGLNGFRSDGLLPGRHGLSDVDRRAPHREHGLAAGAENRVSCGVGGTASHLARGGLAVPSVDDLRQEQERTGA